MERAYSLLNVKAISERADEWVISGVASTPTPDRMGDVVEPLGAKFKLPMPLLWQHHSELPVGRVEFAKPTKDGIPYVAHLPKVAEAGALRDRIEEAVQSIKYRLVGAVSIGFRGLAGAIENLKDGGLRFKEWEWLELSLVTIPANAEATITSIKSLDSALLAAAGRNKQGASPGDSGNRSGAASGRSDSKPRLKGTEMKTMQELREERSTKAARLGELVEAFRTDGHEATDDEATEFDALTAEVKTLDQDIRIATFHAMQGAAAKSVDGSSAASGAASRGGLSFVRKADPEDAFKGQSYTRMIIAKAAAFIAAKDGNYVSPVEVAKARWGKTHPKLVEYIRTAVAGGGTGSGEWGAELAMSDARFTGDFIEYLYSKTVFDALPLRPVPARVNIKGQDGASTGYWVGESKAIPVGKSDYSDVELTPLKVAAISVCSKELVRDSSPSAEMLIRDDIAQASAQRVDTTFLSATAASSGVSPAGLLNGVTAGVPSGTDAAAVRADMMTLYSGFLSAKNASGLVQVMTPSMAKALSLLVNSLGQTEFPNLNAMGGTLLGDTVYTGDNVTGGYWLLLKPSDIWKIGDGGLEVSISDQATIEQNDAPQGAGDTPTAASATLMSLWQTEQIGFKVVRRINYQKRRSGAVAWMDNCEYGGVAS
jgi:HK97 family phage prohead protease